MYLWICTILRFYSIALTWGIEFHSLRYTLIKTLFMKYVYLAQCLGSWFNEQRISANIPGVPKSVRKQSKTRHDWKAKRVRLSKLSFFGRIHLKHIRRVQRSFARSRGHSVTIGINKNAKNRMKYSNLIKIQAIIMYLQFISI